MTKRTLFNPAGRAVATLVMLLMAANSVLAANEPAFIYASEGAKKILKYQGNKVVWEYPAEMSRDAWCLPNGNVLFCYNNEYNSRSNNNPSGVMEVTSDKRVVFHFATTGQVWSCQRMADGNTLVGAASQGKLLVVSPETKVIKEILLKNKAGHSCIRNVRHLANGHFLVAEESAQMAREYDANGQCVREIKVDFRPYSAIRLANGNTFVCGQQKIVELDASDKVLWSIEGKELPEQGIRWFAGLQVLPSGNLFICNAGGKVPVFELTRDKQIVWQSKPAGDGIFSGHGIQRTDVR